jgi:hypothetical protein
MLTFDRPLDDAQEKPQFRSLYARVPDFSLPADQTANAENFEVIIFFQPDGCPIDKYETITKRQLQYKLPCKIPG